MGFTVLLATVSILLFSTSYAKTQDIPFGYRYLIKDCLNDGRGNGSISNCTLFGQIEICLTGKDISCTLLAAQHGRDLQEVKILI